MWTDNGFEFVDLCNIWYFNQIVFGRLLEMDNNENGSKIERLTKTNGVKSFVIILFVLELDQLNRELDNENTFFIVNNNHKGYPMNGV